MRYRSIQHAFLLLTFVLGAVVEVGAQRIKLVPDERAEDGQYKKLMLVCNMFMLFGDSVAQPLDIASAKPGDAVNFHKVKLPPMSHDFENGYGYLYNGSSMNSFAPYQTLVVCDNPRLSYFPSRIWVDRNNNYDLTDDGGPDTLENGKSVVLNLDNNVNGYKVELEHFNVPRYEKFALMNDQNIEKVQGKRFYLGTRGSFRERRLNVLAGRWSNGADSFVMAVKDVNCNGIYNEPGTDVMMMARFDQTLDNLQGELIGDKGRVYMEFNGAAYNILEVEKQGNYILFDRDTAAKLKNSLNTGQKLPCFKYCTATKPSRHRSVRKLKGKLTYIYFWRDDLPGYHKDSAVLHLLGRMEKKDFQVLGLNYGSSGKYIVRYNRIFHTNIVQGFSSNKINKKLKLKSLPTGILVDERQRIIRVGISPAQMLELVTH